MSNKSKIKEQTEAVEVEAAVQRHLLQQMAAVVLLRLLDVLRRIPNQEVPTRILYQAQ